MNSQSTFLILTDFWLFFQKDVNQITLNLKLSFTNIRGLRSSFVDYESFLEPNSPDILVLCERNLDDSSDPGNFSILGPTLVLPYINDLPDDVICILLSMLMILLLILSVIRYLMSGNN